MPAQLLRTKCHLPPARPNSVPRTRLCESLQGGLLAGRKLTLISAPAGYGKTTLAADWAQQTGLSVAWLSLDEQDNEFGRFLAYLLLSLQQVADDAGAQIRLILDTPQLPPVEVIAGGLCDDLARLGESNGRFLLTLDDYHKIRQPLIHDLLNRLLEHLPPTCHLLLISREDPPLSLPRLRVRGEMTEIRAQELRFTVTEAEQFFNQTMQLGLPSDWVAALETRTEGWIASLQLAALSLHGRDAAQTEAFIRAFGGSHRYVFDYLAEEVLGQQPEEIRAFLRATAVLDRFNAPLCHALTGRADSQAILHQLEQANLFLVPLDDARHWYRYHHLFADYLNTLIDRPEKVRLFKTASEWHLANDLTLEAMRYALASADFAFAANVLEQALHNDATWSGFDLGLFSAWLDVLPVAVLQDRPELNLNAARIFYLARRFELAEKHIAQAEQSSRYLPTSPEAEQLQALATLYRGSIASVRGDFRQAIEQIALAQASLQPENHLAHSRAFFGLGLAYKLAGQTERATQHYLRSADEARTAGVDFLVVHAQCNAAQVQMTQGRLRLAEQTCQQAAQYAKEAGHTHLGLPLTLFGALALERNDLMMAEQNLQDGLALSRKSGLTDDVTLGMASLARLRVAQGDIIGALAAIQEAHAITQTQGIPRLSLLSAAHLARIQLDAGQKEVAAQWARTYQSTQSGYLREFEELTLARILLALGELDALPALLDPLLAQAEATGRGQSCLEAMLLLAQYHQAQGETAVALEWLGKAVQLAAPEGYARLFLEGERPLLPLLPAIRTVAPDWVDSILAMADMPADSRTPLLAELPEPLSEQEYNVLRLLCTGLSNREIADSLFISPGTAKWHVHNILQKLSVANRAQVIIRARELGLADRKRRNRPGR
jgi:LuxR family transcriptional regulator, maltose regulon positive regulatory protein